MTKSNSEQPSVVHADFEKPDVVEADLAAGASQGTLVNRSENLKLVGESIDAIGFGKFQWRLTLTCAFGFLADQVRDNPAGDLSCFVALSDAFALADAAHLNQPHHATSGHGVWPQIPNLAPCCAICRPSHRRRCPWYPGGQLGSENCLASFHIRRVDYGHGLGIGAQLDGVELLPCTHWLLRWWQLYVYHDLWRRILTNDGFISFQWRLT